MKKKVAGCAALVLVLALVYALGMWYPLSRVNTADKETPNAESKFDVSALESWCGEPTGKIRMVGGWFYEENVLEDELGNLWGFDGAKEDAFYLLWIDDMGTADVKDDEILKVWSEFYG